MRGLRKLVLGSLGTWVILAPAAFAQSYGEPIPLARTAHVPHAPPSIWPNFRPSSPPPSAPSGPAVYPPAPPMIPNGRPGLPEYWEEPFATYAPYQYYAGVGWLGLKRQENDRRPLFVRDPVTSDDNNPAPADAPVLATTRSPAAEFYSGVRWVMGLANQDAALEFAGFVLPDQTQTTTLTSPGRISGIFSNAPGGFANIFDNADRVHFRFRHQLYSLEGNYHWASAPSGAGFDYMVGVRYVDLQERYAFTVEDNSIQVAPNPAETATYSTRTHNHLIGGSLGWGARTPILEWLGFSWFLRGSWFANRADIEVELLRHDGLVGTRGSSSTWRFSHMYEINVACELYLGDFCRIKGGYNVLWLLDVAEAANQVSYDLSNPRGQRSFGGDIFYHGPSVEVEFNF
ncbi:MAG: hypothetical protein RMI91_00805 [Gemmatales bacterium]|nr:hypothetical protein [Gemmatales bacterium]MDW7993172.1 hypothetical protein [Gemmatales bacterium]